jgi:protein TonB
MRTASVLSIISLAVLLLTTPATPAQTITCPLQGKLSLDGRPDKIYLLLYHGFDDGLDVGMTGRVTVMTPDREPLPLKLTVATAFAYTAICEATITGEPYFGLGMIQSFRARFDGEVDENYETPDMDAIFLGFAEQQVALAERGIASDFLDQIDKSEPFSDRIEHVWNLIEGVEEEVPIDSTAIDEPAIDSPENQAVAGGLRPGESISEMVARQKGNTAGLPMPTRITDHVFPHPDDTVVVDKLPEMIREAQPPYPQAEYEAGIAATVWVRALVNDRGGVVDAKIDSSSGIQPFDNSAVSVAYQNRFKPAELDGNPIASWISYPVPFDTTMENIYIVPRAPMPPPSRYEYKTAAERAAEAAVDSIAVQTPDISVVESTTAQIDTTPPNDPVIDSISPSEFAIDTLPVDTTIVDTMTADTTISDTNQVSVNTTVSTIDTTTRESAQSYTPPDIQQPVLVTEVQPIYPPSVKEKGVGGVVWVRAMVDTLGNVVSAQIGTSSGIKKLDDAALAAAMQNKFSPGLQNGMKVPMWATYEVKFELGDEK